MTKNMNKKFADWASVTKDLKGKWQQDQVAAANGWLLAFVQTNHGTGQFVMIRDGVVNIGTYEYMGSTGKPTDANFIPAATATFTTDKFAWRHLVETQNCDWLPARIGCGFDWSQVVKVKSKT